MRVRLKLRRSAGKNDASLAFDAYRTQIGMSQLAFGTLVIVGGMAAAAALIAIVALIAELLNL